MRHHRKFLAVSLVINCIIFVGVLYAQDKPLGNLLESTAKPTEATVTFNDDGTCSVVAVGTVASDSGDTRVYTSKSFKLGGVKCTNLLDKAMTALKKAAGVGDGTPP